MKTRLLAFGIFFMLFIIAFTIGSETSIQKEDAQVLVDQVQQSLPNVNETENLNIEIALHNLGISMIMFVPGVGIALGTIAAYSTGTAFSAILTVHPEVLTSHPITVLLMTPFGILEAISYGIAMSRSYLLINALLKHRLRQNIKPSLIEVCIVIGLLFLGGIIEAGQIMAGV